MVLLEAMAAGVPVICSDCGGGREVVGESEWLFALGSAQALGQRLVRMAIERPQSQAGFVEALHDRIVNMFSDPATRRVFWHLSMLQAIAREQ